MQPENHRYLSAQNPALKKRYMCQSNTRRGVTVVLILQQTSRESLLVISLHAGKTLILFRFMITSDNETFISTCIPWSAAYEELPYIVLHVLLC
jgi:hypothetical protein